MTANQVQRLKGLIRHNHTNPPYLQEKIYGWNSKKTAEKLIVGLDWDGSIETRPLQQDIPSQRRPSQDSDLFEENQVLRRQVQILLGQLAGGSKVFNNIRENVVRAQGYMSDDVSAEGLPIPQLPAIEGKEKIRHLSGSLTDRPRSDRVGHHGRGELRRNIALPRPKIANSVEEVDKEQVEESKKVRRDYEAKLKQIESHLAAVSAEKHNLAERIWGLEECLVAKDSELALQRAELEHLRYLIGVKEGDEAYLLRRMAYMDGQKAEQFYIEPGTSITEVGKQMLHNLEGACYAMEDFLKESEAHLAAGEETGMEAGLLIDAVLDEARRRELTDAQISSYRGKNGEYMRKIKERVAVLADVEIQCELMTGEHRRTPSPEAESGGEFTLLSGQQTTKKRKLRRTKGVMAPFDTIIRFTDRWLKEKDVRMSLLNEKKILQQVTALFCNKISVDASDDGNGMQRSPMHTYVNEYFLSAYGFRSLSDFYLMELIEGVKKFYQNQARIAHFAKFCGMPFAGESLDTRTLDFYLYVMDQLAKSLQIQKPAAVRKPRGESSGGGLRRTSSPEGKRIVKGQGENVEYLNVIDMKTKNDQPIVFKRKMGWKAIRRAFVAVCDYKWLPAEYSTPEEVEEDAKGIAKQDVKLDDVLDLALAQYKVVYEARRQHLSNLFEEADADKSGALDFQEFKALLSKIGPHEESQAMHLFRQCLQEQEDDTLSLDIFCKVMLTAKMDSALIKLKISRREGQSLEALSEKHRQDGSDDGFGGTNDEDFDN